MKILWNSIISYIPNETKKSNNCLVPKRGKNEICRHLNHCITKKPTITGFYFFSSYPIVKSSNVANLRTDKDTKSNEISTIDTKLFIGDIFFLCYFFVTVELPVGIVKNGNFISAAYAVFRYSFFLDVSCICYIIPK